MPGQEKHEDNHNYKNNNDDDDDDDGDGDDFGENLSTLLWVETIRLNSELKSPKILECTFA